MSKTESSTIKVEKGLSKITFEGDYKQQCSLQNSNAVLENKIWLGVDKDINGTAVNAPDQGTGKNMLPY
ncbi:MAG TPA: hypothetical protein DCQ26_03865 [Marinilabiliales bacterium]|nr:MAG: hypothetical protein A2W84_00945 [Bacteroidetes bacterium GWC2_40_13]OFX71396.1 MAG: hypothetical protein A2W96_14675 [Bacteroidetes bacterium GWD2_40_43]OFX91408.1 MAG: hypothetical protein A2W97_04180 [Bacteroidetes bacterium GWE2_40_63]OFY19477.1 MAG: hypothetical protein A2W88_02060 [Bacteroidetes bacterium GWF2_40_13]OFZ25626.1 MAG: hypothetical protein A2437_12465 [Bacteroidetes bacterium RIFOXYC2_FULL_40_12]HAM97724.1 hypothetical protein [Marinilabiliales bacterium]